MAGATKIKVFYRSQALRTNKKTKQNRFRSLSNEACHQDRAKNWSLDPPGSVLKGSAALLCSSWALLGVSWLFLDASWTLLGRVLGSLRCLLAGLWRLLGAFWRPEMPGASILKGFGTCRVGLWNTPEACFAYFLLSCAFRYIVISLMQSPRFCTYLSFSCGRQFGHLGRFGHLGDQLGHLGQQLITLALTSQRN